MEAPENVEAPGDEEAPSDGDAIMHDVQHVADDDEDWQLFGTEAPKPLDPKAQRDAYERYQAKQWQKEAFGKRR